MYSVSSAERHVDLLDVESAQLICKVILVVKQSAETVVPDVAEQTGEPNLNTSVGEPPLIDDYESI